MPNDIRLFLCDGGSIELPLSNFFVGRGGGGETLKTPVSWYLLTHPRGNVIVDGGNAPAVADDPEGHLGPIAQSSVVTMTADEAVLPTLARLGVEPESIRWVLQTHLHFDHTGALAVIDQFPNAEVLVTRTEYEFAHVPDVLAEPLYCKRDYIKPGVRWSLLEPTDDGYDLFGDGTLLCWRTPGHSPGHQSLEVHLPSGSAYFLMIDAAYTMEHLEEKAVSAFMVSASDTIASVRKIRRLAWRAQAQLIAGHDLDQWETLTRAPDWYS